MSLSNPACTADERPMAAGAVAVVVVAVITVEVAEAEAEPEWGAAAEAAEASEDAACFDVELDRGRAPPLRDDGTIAGPGFDAGRRLGAGCKCLPACAQPDADTAGLSAAAPALAEAATPAGDVTETPAAAASALEAGAEFVRSLLSGRSPYRSIVTSTRKLRRAQSMLYELG